MRLFVSVDLPEDLAEPIGSLQSKFEEASGLDFTDPSQAHVTMKFLGDTPERRVETIEEAIEEAVHEANVEPFEATFEGLGVFPSLEYISVLWLGVGAGGDCFETLQAPIEDRLVDIGFSPEDHDFTPHVTLARMQHAGGKEGVQELVRTEEPTIGTMTIEEVRLTESTLTADGPMYETIHRVEL